MSGLSARTDWAQTARELRAALASDAANPLLHSNLGYALLRLDRAVESLQACDAALGLQPRCVPAWINRSAALEALGRTEQAIAAAEESLRLAPEDASVQRNLGTLARQAGHTRRATHALLEAVRLDPRDAASWCNLALTLCDQAQIDPALQAIGRAIALQPDNLDFASNLQVIAQYHSEWTASDLREMAAQYAPALLRAGIAPVAADARPRRPGRLRVGYLSPDLCVHPVGFLLSGVLAGHDRERFEVHAIDLGRRQEDDVTQGLRSEVEHWHRWVQRDPHALAAQLSSLELDVLIDLAGHTAGNALPAVALTPARRRYCLLGWFASLGLPGLDAMLIGDSQLVPGHSAFFAEPVHPLPGTQFRYCGVAHAPAPANRPIDAAITFGCFNNTAKLNDAVLHAWRELLCAVPGSRLVLKWKTLGDPDFAATLRARLCGREIDPQRIELQGQSLHHHMLSGYADIDIALDPFPFSGGMSTLEALWMGVPVVTLAQLRPVSRQTAAVLALLGLQALVASSVDDYVRRAVRLAADGAQRMQLRQTLRQRILGSQLGDPAGLARELEALYEAPPAY